MRINLKSLISYGFVMASVLIGLTGCTSMKLPTGAKVYQIDIQQGNAISDEQLNKIQAGMPQNQVKALLGEPILTDIFHKDRWNYPYYAYKTGRLVETKTVSILFDDKNQVKEILK